MKEKNQKTKKKPSKAKKIFLSILAFLFIVLFTAAFLFFQHVTEGLPTFEQLENPKQRLASKVYSADGVEIGSFFRQARVETSIDSIPKHFINALIATEDRKFYDHWGVDLERFFKAMVKNVFMFKREGASTLTQQLAKNIYALKTPDENIYDTIVRKLREWITAVQLEKSYTKNEILEMYLNESYFGKGAYGIASAADVYFDKRVQDLTIPEASLFVALLKSSVWYDPVKRYNNAIQRRNIVMYNMTQTGHLSGEEYQQLKEEPIKLSLDRIKARFKSSLAPHFVEHIRQEMEELSDQYNFDIYEDGLSIYTSLDTRMQRIANESVKTHLDEFQTIFDKRWNWNKNRELLNDHIDVAIRRREEYKQAETAEEKKAIYERLKKNVAFVDSVQQIAQTIEVGFVALDNTNGQIKAMVGGRDLEFAYGLNHATQITRQPGSSFKPIVYIVALDNGLYPAYPVLNQPFNYEGWEPKNFTKTTSGFMTMREALRHSINLVSARLIIEGHIELWKIGRYAQKMGIKTKLDLVPSISLGTAEVSPLEITSAYATIANRGIYNEPISILRIEDKDGIVINNFFPETQEAISAETAFLITDMMQDVVNRGSGTRVRTYFNRPAAGKTGTTQAYGDAWFVGFTPQLAAGVWVGFDDRRIAFTGNYGQGSRAALPIWAMFMKGVYEEVEMPIEEFHKPQNGDIAKVNFCKDSILELGDPKIISDDCNSGTVSDYIKLQDIPSPFNARRDTSVKIFERYMAIDSTAHEAFEIVDESGL